MQKILHTLKAGGFISHLLLDQMILLLRMIFLEPLVLPGKSYLPEPHHLQTRSLKHLCPSKSLLKSVMIKKPASYSIFKQNAITLIAEGILQYQRKNSK